MQRTFTVEQDGRKFATVCRADGYWTTTWRSKTKRRATWKGQQFVAGLRIPGRLVLAWHGSVPSPFLAIADET